MSTNQNSEFLSQGHSFTGQSPGAGHISGIAVQNQSLQVPTVTTVTQPNNAEVSQSQQSEAAVQQTQNNEGMGVDARTQLDPKEEAERKLKTSPPAPGAADGRVALLQSAILSELPKFIIESVLENPELSKVKDAAAAKVHGVELLKLLTQDPGYGLKFQLILNDIPAWKNYKSQDHSLFITGPEQKTDYFLTDGSNGEPTKMLTQG